MSDLVITSAYVSQPIETEGCSPPLVLVRLVVSHLKVITEIALIWSQSIGYFVLSAKKVWI